MKTILIWGLFFLSAELFAQSDTTHIKVDSSILYKHGKIIFEFDKAVIRKESYKTLDSVAAFMIQNPHVKLEVQNHSDGRQKEIYSVNITQRRAQKIRDYLIVKGVAADRLTAKGYGDTKVLIANSEILKMKTKEEQESAHQKNRRTEFVVVK